MPFKSSELVKCLKELVKCKYGIFSPSEVLAKSEKFLTLVPTVSSKQLTPKEKQNVGLLLSKTLYAIELNITCASYCPSSLLLTTTSEKKFILQYLIDNYFDCPVDSTTLGAKFNEMNTKGLRSTKKLLRLIDEEPYFGKLDIEEFSSHLTRSSKFSTLIECLKEVKYLKYCNSVDRKLNRTDKFLRLVCTLGTMQLTKEEKQEIGPLISDSLESIIFNIRRTRYCPSHWVRITASEKKHALQYLIKECSDCPVESTTLAAKFKEINIRQLIQMLDSVKDAKWIPGQIEEYSLLQPLSTSDKSSELIRCLKDLVKFKFDIYSFYENIALSERVLLLVYAIHREHLTLKKEEKQQVVLLISEILQAIELNISHACLDTRNYLLVKRREKRQALQYLMDDYSDYPVGLTTLAVKFEEINIKELIEKLDNVKIDEQECITDSEDPEYLVSDY